MSFLSGLGGGSIGGGQIVLGAATSGLRREFKAAVTQIKSDMGGMATDAQVSGNRTAAGLNKVGAAADRSAAQVQAASARSGAAMQKGAVATESASARGSLAMKKAAAEAEASGGRWSKVFGIIGNAAKIGMLGVVGAVAVGVKTAADFQKNWAAVVKTVGGTAPQMAKLREEVRGLAREMPVSVNALAKIAETGGALGVPINQIKEFVRVTAMIGATTNVSTEQAADALGVLGNILKLRATDYASFGSSLIVLGNKGASTEKQILDVATRIGTAGKQIGLTTPQILAWSSAVSSLVPQAQAGGTALSRFFNQITMVTFTPAKAAAGTKDLTKLREQLGVAEQRLSEIRGKAHTKLSTLMAAENRVVDLQRQMNAPSGKAGAAGGAEQLAKIAGTSVKAWKAMLDPKSAGYDPNKALTDFITGFGKLPAAAQLAVLKSMKLTTAATANAIRALGASPDMLKKFVGMSEESYRKQTALQENYARKTANFLDRLTILLNVIKDALISLGDMVLPVLTQIVDYLSKNLPAALAFLGTIWATFFDGVRGPIGDLAKSFGGLIDAFSGDKANKGIDWAQTMRTVVGGLANVVGTLATALGKVIDIGAGFVRSPIGQFAVNALVPILALGVAVRGLFELAKRLSGSALGIGKGIASFIPGLPGFLRRPGAAAALTPEAQALNGSAVKLDTSAAALEKAALAIQKAAFSEYGSPVSGLGIAGDYIEGVTPPMRNTNGGGKTPTYGYDNGRLNSVPIALKDEYLRNRGAMDAAGRGIVRQTAGALADGVRGAASGVKSLAGGAFGVLKGVGSLVGKLFFPLMIADMVTEFAKQPISDFLAQTTGFKNVAKKMSTDFWGGAADLVISALNGTDAWVGHADELKIGNAKIKTIDVAKMGFTSAEIGTVETPTLDNGGFDRAKEIAAISAAGYKQRDGESTADYQHRIINAAKSAGIAVPELTQTGGPVGQTYHNMGTAYQTYDPAQIQSVVDSLVTAEVGGVKDTFDSAVQTALQKMGYSFGQTDSLPEDVLQKLGHLIGANVNGKINGLVMWAAREAIGATGGGKILTAQEWQRSRQSAEKVDLFTPAMNSPFYAPVGGLAGAAYVPPLQTANSFGAHQNVLANLQPKGYEGRRGRSGFAYSDSVGNEAQVAAAAGAFQSNLARVLQPMKATYQNWLKNVVNDPTGTKQAAAAAGQQFLDEFGDAMGTSSAKGPKKSVRVLEMARAMLGPDAITTDKKGVQRLADGAWAQMWAIYQESLSATGETQRRQIRATQAAIIKQGAQEGAADAAAQMTPLFFAENQKAIAAALADPKGKKMTALLASFNKANPTSQFGSVAGFTAAYNAWQKTGMLDPSKSAEATMKLADVHTEMEDVASAATNLVGALGNLATVITNLLTPKDQTATGGGGGRSGQHLMAGGGIFDTRGRMNLTVGEAGDEHVAVLRNFTRVNLPDFFTAAGARPRLSGQAAQHGGRMTQIIADKLQVLGPADETSLLGRFAFLSNT